MQHSDGIYMCKGRVTGLIYPANLCFDKQTDDLV